MVIIIEVFFTARFLKKKPNNYKNYEILDINYLSRNIIFLAYDAKYKYYGRSVNEFLQQYLDPNLTKISQVNRKCGVIRHAINIDFEQEDFNDILFSFSTFISISFWNFFNFSWN